LKLDPLYGIRLRTPRLELRLGTREELAELGRLAQAGIHPSEHMPFAVAWTDRSGEPTFVDEFVRYHEDVLETWEPERWSLNLLVFHERSPVGSQSIRAEHFAASGEVDTGSWLGLDFQRRGLGTEMRTAVLELAFRGLGAKAATSGAIVGNEASKRVSEKLGYRLAGMSIVSPRDEPVDHYDLRIERTEWKAPFQVEMAGVDRCLPLFGLSESS
jgi:RimJ/RimL family protein N-acetyltransferase